MSDSEKIKRVTPHSVAFIGTAWWLLKRQEPCLIWMVFEAKFRKAFTESGMYPSGIPFVCKDHHEIVRIPSWHRTLMLM